MTIRPFAMPAGPALQPMTQELIAAEMMKTVPQWAKPKKWHYTPSRGAAIEAVKNRNAARWAAVTPTVLELRAKGFSQLNIAREVKIGIQVIRRILMEEGEP